MVNLINKSRRPSVRARAPSTDDTTSPSSKPPPSIIGSTIVMKGELTVGEDLVIEGTFDGTINGKDPGTVSIRKIAVLSGEVTAGRVRVQGGANIDNIVLSGHIDCTDD